MRQGKRNLSITPTENHQTTEEETKRRRKEQRNYKIARKQITKW